MKECVKRGGRCLWLAEKKCKATGGSEPCGLWGDSPPPEVRLTYVPSDGAETLLLEAYCTLKTCEHLIAPLSNYELINRIAKHIDRPFVRPLRR